MIFSDNPIESSGSTCLFSSFKPVVSYTTRPKRENETDGVEHYFITPEEAKEKLKTEHVLAYTKIGEYEYFATVEALNDSNLYIIDPNGVKYLKENFPELNIKIIYIKVDDNVRIERIKKRDINDYNTKFKPRNEAENERFTEFENSKAWDLLIDNTNEKTLDMYIKIQDFLYKSETDSISNNKKSPLYLIVGRTGSGKDTITRNISTWKLCLYISLHL